MQLQQNNQAIKFLQYVNQQNWTPVNIIKYNSEKLDWQSLNPNSNQPQQIKANQIAQFTTLTLNVLTDSLWQAPLKRNILFSQDRYTYILSYLKSIHPHIITLNEVTQHFYSMLIKEKWVRDNYWVSQFNWKQSDGSFNVILGRINILATRWISTQNLKRNICVAYFLIAQQKNQSIVSVSSAHLTSLTKNIQRRKNQLTQLTNKLKSEMNYFTQVCHIIQGDLNIHSETQTPLFSKLQFKDCWLQYHYQLIPQLKDNFQNTQDNYKQILMKYPGYTFDSKQNSLIKQVYWGFQQRRMRLDRILYKAGNTGVKCKQIKVILNQAIYEKGKKFKKTEKISEQKQNIKEETNQQKQYPKMGKTKGLVSLLGDIAGFNIFRKKQEYLYPSDHFGLLCKFSINSKMNIKN